MAQLTTENLIDIRRHLHAHPELAMHEFETHQYLLAVIKGVNQQYLEIREVPDLPTALLVYIHGSDPKRTIGYRTDIDALPVTEKTGLPFASKTPGVMHACGHDIHMTVALGVLSWFSEHQPKDNMVFFFQPAEESQNGGKVAYEQGVFAGKWRPDEFYGLHDNPNLPAGAIGCRMGTLFAGTTEVNVDLIGKSGHAAYPQDANDMVVAAAQFINQVQTIVSRSVNPIEGGVITFGKLDAGTIRNVIAGQARIEGTIRGLTQKMIEHIVDRLKQVANGVATSYGATVNIAFNQGGYLPVENNDELTKRFINFAKQDPQTQFIETQPAMTGEDFGYLLSKIPGTMFWLGVEDDSALHAATLNPKESSIPKGVNSIVRFLEFRQGESVL
ncbi:MAG: N-acetyldiaminopimelate deacetylase [Lentilactobacillus hilgardii]|jgi:N-acetyldiaminopimelate deacetylase|uniref:N-acetyldiaminopimelate deacetylase n=2 Tax=Lentilactobacillus hilgardii TaxID=1588 RepID=C0XH33_LENH9|nr:N-acetyldiaminopimelate deacetylase [Lentilactobacillus hilgardii]EEI19387.1 amidohydrolase [Lentilactobacillus buchneri ATCC 11577]RRG12557.1 MAG: N-acetyldiaminopimelate deacetylase [Lactobacillus sp.]EEI25299.1 amidohydrolase [Lentilactobacillus hilgardii DSM 20176 = ATCC 8290]EEI70883.1 amidohydrolase [Lentilactobacillus hilgardii ATCC 27305]KRK53871.1 amidohydrolase [Lentilactobacillus hilgardii DSM 20176 = ATCC 8290]